MKKVFYDVRKFFDEVKEEIVIDGLESSKSEVGVVLARIDTKSANLRIENTSASLCSNTLKAIGESYILLAESRLTEITR